MIFSKYRQYFYKIFRDDQKNHRVGWAATRKSNFGHLICSFWFLSLGEGRGRALWWLPRRDWGSNIDYHHQLRIFCGSKIEEQWDRLHSSINKYVLKNPYVNDFFQRFRVMLACLFAYQHFAFFFFHLLWFSCPWANARDFSIFGQQASFLFLTFLCTILLPFFIHIANNIVNFFVLFCFDEVVITYYFLCMGV